MRPSLDLRRPTVDRHPNRPHRRRSSKPEIELLEDRRLLTLPAISAVQQYGIPSVLAIDSSGNVSYNFLEDVNGEPQWAGWSLIPGGVGATAISTGTVLVGALSEPYVFLLNSAGTVSYNFLNNSDQWNGWVQVGTDIGATAISSGVLPIVSQPFVFAIDSSQNIEFNYESSSGAFSQWSTIASGAAATAISSGFIQATASPVAFEPYVFAPNSSGNVEYTQRDIGGTWMLLLR